MPRADTREELLDLAQELVQARGFNAFSFKDLAKSVGIRTPSVHYHFETKADLGEALMRRYREGLDAALDGFESRRTARSRLRALVDLYRETGDSGLACLCGSLAADVETLPDVLRPHIAGYLDRTETWVAAQIREGRTAGEFAPTVSDRDLATLLVSGLQGALFLGRARGDASGLNRIERAFWKLLEA